MAEETKTALAALFRMRGQDTISETEFVHETSYKLRWFTPKEAQRFLEIGLNRGLLRAGAGTVQAAFDISAVEVPLNYRPGPEALTPPKSRDLFSALLVRIESAMGWDRPSVVARINQAQERLGVDADVAASHVARSLGVDVSDLLPEVEAEVLRRAR